jgi:UDP-2,3-diacylglucosamine pyrophosphatase LpxH
MKVDFHEERLLVTSDAHLGSFFCDARRGMIRFFEYACENGYNVCINGDGIDVLHTSLARIVRETADFLRDCRAVVERTNITIYYTIGNHDIVLEQYLADWGPLRLVPFINLTSGDKRIRIEHGHLYDQFFSRHPDMQDALTRFGGLICRVYPPWYNWYKLYGIVKYQAFAALGSNDEPNHNGHVSGGVAPSYIEAAEELARRGFDAVIFGHTHHHGVLPLNDNRAQYLNTGSWFGQPHFVEINNGEISLRPWTKTLPSR